MLAPWAAELIASRMKRLLNEVVERAMQVTIVKGLNKKLETLSIFLRVVTDYSGLTLHQLLLCSIAAPSAAR